MGPDRPGAGPGSRPGPRPFDRPQDERPTRARPAGGLPPPEELGPDEELIAGRRPVEEAFVADRRSRRLLVTPARRQALERIVLHATRLRIPIVEVEGGTLTALTGFDGHQGVALVVEPRRFATLDDVLTRSAERGEPPFILVVDSLEDPQNLGTLLRSAEGAGVHGVIFPTHRQAPLTPAAVKASAGAVEHLLLAPVDDLAGALADLHVRGVRVVGSDAEAPLTARQADLRGPLALVVGSEGRGLGPAVRRRTDMLVRIPMRGAVGSLNAAVAGSVLLFEAVAQRDPEGRSAPPRATSADDEPELEGRRVPPAAHGAATWRASRREEAVSATPPGAVDGPQAEMKAPIDVPDGGRSREAESRDVAGTRLAPEPDAAGTRLAPEPDVAAAVGSPSDAGGEEAGARDAGEGEARAAAPGDEEPSARDAAEEPLPGGPRPADGAETG